MYLSFFSVFRASEGAGADGERLNGGGIRHLWDEAVEAGNHQVQQRHSQINVSLLYVIIFIVDVKEEGTRTGPKEWRKGPVTEMLCMYKGQLDIF